MVYHIFANRTNIGDFLSARGIQKLLSPLPITECLCDEPFIEETRQILSNATTDDFVIIGGGGLIMDYFIPFWEMFSQFVDRIPFFIWGIGCCDLKNEHSLPPHALIENIFNRSELCIVRDDITKSYLANCHIPEPIACPSINIVKPLENKEPGILHVANYSTAGAQVYEVMCAQAQKFAAEKNIIYRETNNRIDQYSQEELDKILLRYKKSNLIISSALHGCIIGLAMGLKVIAVSGDRKIDAFMKSIGLEDWILDTTEVTRIPAMLQKLELQITPWAKLDEIRVQNENVAFRIKQIISARKFETGN
jgi:polysaccharide pyruvyl transferase WcaK-like protein